MSKRWSQFDDDESRSSSSQSSFLSQTQNPLHNDQTLEEAFSLLSVYSSPFNHPSFDFDANAPSALNDTSKFPPCHGCDHGSLITPQSSNLCPSSHSSFSTNGYSSSYDDRFFDSEPLMRQREFNSVFPNVPLSNGVQQKPLGGNLLGTRLNIPWFNVAERRLHWFSDFRRRVLLMAKDQHGCMILQETMKRLTGDEFSIIFWDLINHVAELMTDPFGNYVVQSMVEICSEEQMTLIILMLARSNLQLIRICLSPHGTRVVEKLLEHVTTLEQRGLVVSALCPGAVILAKDINGHRVLLHCLNSFSEKDNKHLLNGVANNCFGIATDKTGCVVLQQCVNHAQGAIKRQLIAGIVVNASQLAQDCYGNYVVQHLLSLKIPAVAESLLRQLKQKFFHLSCNKYGSNIVEKFFQESGERHSTYIILELLSNPDVARLLVDPYGNYVIKSALSISTGLIRDALENLIQLNSSMMCSNLYGKKLLAWFEKGGIRHV